MLFFGEKHWKGEWQWNFCCTEKQDKGIREDEERLKEQEKKRKQKILAFHL